MITKQKLLDTLKVCNEGTSILITVGNRVDDVKIIGNLRGTFYDPETNVMLVNFNEYKE